MRKPTKTQVRVAAFLAEIAAECALDPTDSATAYLTRISQEFDVPLGSLMRAVISEPNAICSADARKLLRYI